jgi:hypothetical protein
LKQITFFLFFLSFVALGNTVNKTNILPPGEITSPTLTDGNILEITDFPYHLMKGISMSFYAELTLNGSISYGKGFNKYRGEYFTIDDTNIYYYFDRTLQVTKAHGLTIDTFLRSSFSVDDSGIANVVLESSTGTFQTTFMFNFRMNFEAFIKTDGQDLANVTLTCSSNEFDHAVWAFGDSYFAVSDSRWVGIMKDWGYFNYLINGLAGQNSTGSYADFERALNYGTPKYLLWFLGMNDTNSEYSSILSLVIDKCNEKGITLILSTTPTVPILDKETIKAEVLASGYRYVDFYAAVGTDPSGNWTTGYLHSDNVHPTSSGAIALAEQVLIDFPELKLYGDENAIINTEFTKVNDSNWSYYYNNTDLINPIFAIEHLPSGVGANTSTFSLESIYVSDNGSVINSTDAYYKKGTFNLAKYWNLFASTLPNGWVNIRFFYSTSLETDLSSSANSFKTNNLADYESELMYVKTNDIFKPIIQINADGYIDIPIKKAGETNNYGVYSGNTYLQLNKVSIETYLTGGSVVKKVFSDVSRTIQPGTIRFNSLINKFQGFNGSTWVNFN